MNRFSYTYCLVKYVHDPKAGEMLNIGVLMFSPEQKNIIGKFEKTYERLSAAFANFEGNHYRSVITNMEYSISRLINRFESSLFYEEPFKDIKGVFSNLVPDLGLSIQFGPVLAGVTSDLESEAEHIFHQLVILQYPQKERKSRSDEEIWTVYNRSLAKQELTKYLRPQTFSAENSDWKFNHTFKNEKWHILAPTTMDYAQVETMQNRAAKLVGETTFLAENNQISKIYILLGEPRIPALRGAYIKAKNLLHKIPIDNEIVEEREAEDFAKELADYMKKHGVLEENLVSDPKVIKDV